ncbi:DNA/RNA helicase, superfamily I [Corynebacterium kutscheri]|uniref:DNA 3'-5' helicase n=1 Tax=Corynebacterium kutscheri TaxID=35755 RepID=A0A0F6R1M3_9CORY|nr:ATP-dependent DNA helicase UvrD2 [Corynebacterium kutscheri]AKE41950.1 DNA/RNA helicase, superfamily I [Corynebacterium kutscheri]VEH10287.1 DNA helicase II [Corynebacterium kutscheri]
MSVNLDHLDSDQRIAATAPRGPVAILAGAGTGKTRTITYRIGHLIDRGQASPNRIMAVTFTTRAAVEMRHRLQIMGIGGVQARTFHSAALRQVRYFWPQIAGNLQWQVLDQKFPLVARATRSVGVESTTENVRDILSEIEWAKARLISPEGYEASIGSRITPQSPSKIAEIYRRYEQSKTTSNGMLLDFDDLLLHTAGAIENSPAIAEEFREQYRSFVVDEYQDVTPLQQRVLNAWLGQRDDLTVVGDANQTIYSFTGATPDYLLGFSRTYPHATVVKLQRDYRSTPQIAQLANTVIDKAKGRAAGTRLELQGMRPAGHTPEFRVYDDEPAEARGVAEKIQQLVAEGHQLHDIAVLFRINAQSALFEQALADKGITYQVRGGEEFFNRPEIKQAISELIRVAQRDDLPEDAVGKNLPRLVRAALASLGLSNQEPEGEQARARWQSLNALAELSEELGLAIPDLDIKGLITQLNERAQSKHPPRSYGVTLASLHAAKGLEWKIVFLVGLVDGTLPISHAIRSGDESIEEERRLYYVGITRAKEYLFQSYALSRQEGGRSGRKRTRFLDGVLADAPSKPVAKTKHYKTCRVCGSVLLSSSEKVMGRCVDCASEHDSDLFDALRAWRLAQAREHNAAAFTIFSDATLHAIAEARPTNTGELLALSGIGQVKAEKYGAQVLAIVAEFVAGEN